MIEVGDPVAWAGEQNPNCAPGYTGKVLAISRKDPDSIKVSWKERGGGYTWERRKNLVNRRGDGTAGVLAVIR